jgi:hypothetical protein
VRAHVPAQRDDDGHQRNDLTRGMRGKAWLEY